MKEEQVDLPPGFVEMQEQHYGLPVQESDPILPPPHAQGSDWLYSKFYFNSFHPGYQSILGYFKCSSMF